MIEVGGQIPHVEWITTRGQRVRYRDIWQRRLLILIATHDARSPGARAYQQALDESPRLTRPDTAIVVFEPAAQDDPAAAQLPSAPSVTIADRWGEVQHVARGGSDSDLPQPPTLVEWLEYVAMKCPECEGEAR
jgi:hypothetical protein